VSKKQADDLRQLSAELEIRMVKATPLGGWGWEGPVPGPGKIRTVLQLVLGCFGKFPLYYSKPQKGRT